MKFTKKHVIYLILVVGIAFFISAYKLPFYVYKPGGADALNPIVDVEDGHQSEGDMHLVTVRGGQATPVQYLWAKVMPHQEILPLDRVRPEGVSEDEYMHAQMQMMESSQEASTVVAYEAAGKDITIDYNGVYVRSVKDKMPAENILKIGDRIVGIDGSTIKESTDLIEYVENKQAGDMITADIVRDDKQLEKEIKLAPFPEKDNKVGIGIGLVTDRGVEVDPEVDFSSGNIGGPSAGLMFSLEIYDQLTEADITKGYQVAGTGEVDYKGNVMRIGSIGKKVVAADQQGCDIFFALNNEEAESSNYDNALKAAKDIDTDMKIVPVKTFADALQYLQDLEPA